MYTEYVGLEQDVASLIEARRENAAEAKNDILRRILRDSQNHPAEVPDCPLLDFGQGVKLPVGERLYLYLSKPNRVDQEPDGIAEVKEDGLYLGNMRIPRSRGSLITPAMREIQRKLGHVNHLGELIMLNAYRQWHVIRDGQLVQLDELKDPTLRRTRAAKLSPVDVKALLKEIGIE